MTKLNLQEGREWREEQMAKEYAARAASQQPQPKPKSKPRRSRKRPAESDNGK